MTDLTDLAKEVEAVITRHLELQEKPGMAIAFTLPPNYEEVHWITNLKRSDGIRILKSTAAKMQAQIG